MWLRWGDEAAMQGHEGVMQGRWRGHGRVMKGL